MSNAPSTSQGPALQNEGPVTRFFRATEIDARMLGMLAALVLIWCIFDIASGILRGNFGGLLGGSFLTPRNLWTLLVQTSSIAIMSTGMVLLIVMRQLDLVRRIHAQSRGSCRVRCFRCSSWCRCWALAIPRSGSLPSSSVSRSARWLAL